ncbi:polysaccharide deacetylase family protein [Brachybacterium sp. NBEC-018]|uniref:polysaccharide deacetylase family protein n=1 Tax=Brachybacterium sp. NBEC-018 TaxID=2996004 RepID=UPI002174D6C2|nr:polysaccharide deacetylase family protein [Brachybacterium sp. NBEC-018]UVY85088.1 polysaccharide deacetylase family protein [Brachybacterium sp. NBEC-018]
MRQDHEGRTRHRHLSRAELRRRRFLAGGIAALGLGGLGVGGAALLHPSGPQGPAGHGRDRGHRAHGPLTDLPDLAAHVPQAAMQKLTALAPATVEIPHLPTAPGLDAAIGMSLAKLLRERAVRGEDATLQVAGRIIASSPHALGVLLDVHEEEGVSTALLWYRAEGDRAFTSPGLVDAEHWRAFVSAVRELAGQERGVDVEEVTALLQEQPRPWGNGPALLPRADGSLDVLLPTVGRGDDARELLLTVPEDTAGALLGEDGLAVRAAIAEPSDHDPEAVTVPDPGGSVTTTEHPGTGGAARAAAARGPRTQLAPLAPEGERPSPVTAPDARLLRAIALTFDDGPSPTLNATLREQLLAERAAATFFMIGRSAQGSPALVAATAAAGHEIGSHSWSHRELSTLQGSALGDEVDKPATALEQAIGRAPSIMRPPFGARNRTTDRAAGALGEGVVLWDVDTLDWKTRDAAKTLAAVQENAHRGSIILMHEIHEQSVAAVPSVLAWLRQAGLTTLTCQEIAQNRLHPGQRISHGAERDGAASAQGTGAATSGAAAQLRGAAR